MRTQPLLAAMTAASCLLLHSFAARSVTPADTAPDDSGANDAVGLATDAQCGGLRDLVVDTLVHQVVVGQYGYGSYGYGYNPYFGGVEVDDLVDAPAAMDEGGGGGGRGSRARPSVAPSTPRPHANRGGGGGGRAPAGPSHHTTTNVQERGVDEADIVKTDGRHVYVLHANELVIARTWPVKKTDLAARVTFGGNMQPTSLYLHGDEIVVQGYSWDAQGGWPQGRTRVIFVDVKDRTAPKVARTVDIEGHARSSRMIGDDVYLVQNTYLQMPQRLAQLAQETVAKMPRTEQYTLRPWDVQARLAETLRATLGQRITDADLAGMLPRAETKNGVMRMACRDVHVPVSGAQLGMTTLARVTPRGVDLVGALVTGGQVYASTTELYVAAPSYHWDRRGHVTYATQVHQFSLGDGQKRPTYVASGAVRGMVLNQFSMDEHEGDLRIATTDWNWNGQQGGNHLFVMRPEGKKLRTIGAIRGMAKGERIYSGRMMGDKGYLVTFRQTDPLFTLDLSDPKNPRVAGELKINGYSSYIHPLDDDLLLTIGQDATDQGRVTGLHLQVFDVKNPAKPVRRHHEKLASKGGYAWSAAESDHHAFTYDAVTKTLALPLSEWDAGYARNGLVIFKLDVDRGFRLKGRVDHAELASQMFDVNCEAYKQNPSHYGCRPEDRRMYTAYYPVQRSMVVDDYIVSMSQAGLEIHGLDDLDVEATLSFTEARKKPATVALK